MQAKMQRQTEKAPEFSLEASLVFCLAMAIMATITAAKVKDPA